MNCTDTEPPAKTLLFVGTYTGQGSEGIYTLQFDPSTGALDSLQLRAKLPNPSFLAQTTDGAFLYAVQETANFDEDGGGVTAFSVNDGHLEVLNSKGSGGAHPCHVSISEAGQLAVSNYTGGNVAVFDLESNGSLGHRQLLNHQPNDTAQVAHAHKALFMDESLFVADLGLDALKRYRQDTNDWIPAQQATLPLPKGAGPRHFTFSNGGNYLYVINELNATITVFQKDDKGHYLPVQTVTTVPKDWEGIRSCADIRLSADGHYLYGSNRGENTVVIFAVDQHSGKLTLVGREPTQGDWPRNFTLSPDGQYLLVANQKSNNITVFKRDLKAGTLSYSSSFSVGSPVCLVFSNL
ncbi:MAG: lactonase family protein [Bacteroidota bacterium]